MLSRVLSLCLGLFCLINQAGELLRPGFDASIWWVAPPLPALWTRALLWLAGLLLVAHGLLPRAGRLRRRATTATLLALLVCCQYNALVFYRLVLDGRVEAGFPLSGSLFAGLALLAILAGCPRPLRGWRPVALAAACCAGFPLLQMFCFGRTDYRRPADAIVVLGARAYADGTPSDALADRVRTGCELYRQGYARWLVFSGGPGDGAVHETEAMRRMARWLGVPDHAILLDRQGVNTRATVRHTGAIFREHDIERVLAVSHYYHLPRIKLCYRRAGREVYTVPAREIYVLRQTPWLLAREVAALWFYYLRPA